MSPGSPIPSITFEINECSGLIVVTTFSSALADAVATRIPENNIILNICRKKFVCFIKVFLLKLSVLNNVML